MANQRKGLQASAHWNHEEAGVWLCVMVEKKKNKKKKEQNNSKEFDLHRGKCTFEENYGRLGKDTGS